jgi:hypothetical protein
MTATRRVLTRGACLQLLASGGQGRVATTAKAIPVIILVNFTLFGEDVLFRPGSGENFSSALADAVVAFETGEVGSGRRAAWDIHVTGVARPFADEAQAFRLSSEMINGWRADR